MTKGILGIIACPMLEDELLFSLRNDPEPKKIYVLDNEPAASFRGKLERRGMPYELVPRDAFYAGNSGIDRAGYRVVVDMNQLGLHAQPKDLKAFVEQQLTEIQPQVDAVGLYYGLCGNYGWDVPAWCKQMGFKPTEVFRDRGGRVCDDCVGVCVGGGPRYLELEKTHTGKLYVTPAVADNWPDFIGNMDFMKGVDALPEDAMKSMGIKGRDDFMRWMFNYCGYTTMLQLDSGLEESRSKFDQEIAEMSVKLELKIQQAEPDWPTLQPAEDLYRRCKELMPA